jgi:hypothetical protein
MREVMRCWTCAGANRPEQVTDPAAAFLRCPIASLKGRILVD